MKQKIWLSNFISQVFETPNKNLTEWFGYYNYDTINESHNKILVNRAVFEGVSIKKCDHIEVGYYDIPNFKWNKIGETDSFNWQQGAMLQWLPGSEDTEVIYNFHEKNEYKSCITNINNGKTKIIDFPIYGIHPSGKFALSLNYKRLYWCRAYHYQPVQDPAYDGNFLNGDGIYKIDIENNTTKLLIKIEDIINVDPDTDFNEAKHWLEHIMISPDGSKFVFLHRYSYGNVMSYGTRLFICDFNGENLKLVKGWRDFGWSHFGWCSSDRFAIYTYIAPKIGRDRTKPGVKSSSAIKNQVYSCIKSIIRAIIPRKLLNKTIGKASFYQLYQVEYSNSTHIIDEIKGGNFDIDGHPSFTIDGSYMITDTYPDKKGIQRLLIYNIISKKDIVLGEFEAPLKGNPASCDLHPKLSRDNNYVAVDTAHSGRHQLMLFKLNWAKIKEAID